VDQREERSEWVVPKGNWVGPRTCYYYYYYYY
jgi:hypothetical protein